MNVETFTHLSRNENGRREITIELQKSLICRLFRRNHILTFEWSAKGWCHKGTGALANDDECRAIYAHLHQC